ncbi:cellulose synthase-like protein G3 isoform X1 [Camellia sinensis]|uniref:cellulose synthase-like protein G3 isoform X1 n=1 Tax=Camellia sinensis TaxID=4442 RepID=UPI001036ED43|nr:cellulose synthase-like protein G3 isoform X1 [Camellia sinensis]
MATQTLHTCTVQQARATINRLHILFHSVATLALLYYRISHLFLGDVPVLSWTLVTISELIFTFAWFLVQAFRWRPVSRAVYPEKLPGNSELPGVDVFICTADPKKEPTVEVMNTVLSAMGLDYPAEKLAVYLSDDGGSKVTRNAMKEACEFARIWIPFCRKYGIKSRCPLAYFSSFGDEERALRSDQFRAEEGEIKSTYELFKKNVEKATECNDIEECAVNDHPPCVEVIHDNGKHGEDNNDQTKLPLLVYVSREKRPSHPHNFKAGALNALLRVSEIMSNGSYVLVLDCDMYCNDPTSARQAMCFHLDPQISQSLAFVQYPQIFYNVSKNDIYDSQARSAYKTKWQGMDGLSGPLFTGTGYYVKRKALFGSANQKVTFLHESEKSNGKRIVSSSILIEEARNLASCTFEKGTTWGREIGYSYDSLLESTFTGYLLHCKGWKSVYLYPKRPCFLGCTTIDMKDAMVQQRKWSSGLVQVGLSKFSPLTYGLSRMSILQSMCYGYFTFVSFHSLAFLLYATIPQLCLLTGIPVYPKLSSTWFALFAIVYASSLCQHLYEVLSSGGSISSWWNEQRIWMIKSVTACLFGCLDVLMKWIGIAKVNFRLTNKAIDQEKLEKYEKGKFDFEGAKLFMVPLTILVVLNIVCFIGGLKGLITEKTFDEMFAQVFLSSLILVFSYPILEGIVQKKGKRKA